MKQWRHEKCLNSSAEINGLNDFCNATPERRNKLSFCHFASKISELESFQTNKAVKKQSRQFFLSQKCCFKVTLNFYSSVPTTNSSFLRFFFQQNSRPSEQMSFNISCLPLPPFLTTEWKMKNCGWSWCCNQWLSNFWKIWDIFGAH